MNEPTGNTVDNFGALVGWKHQDLGDRVVVCMQSKHSSGGAPSDPVDEFHYIMTKNQAAVLANYLFTLSGRLPQAKRRFRWFR
ncbi:hypothetical protein A6F68_00778 [Tsuneonella dongtanensis]|uniref:Uncharacterized protein n=1 Tax=Tsuneonella dongtanensis TaxID=692370 RepID=A0A1B2AAW9_9SPHN|nr:hypothetical protein [Tsuneonella dongtanensis]ANY19307.1 hypothetical protein A6F68_00778 [Tsuneonella dongtanensis]